MPRASVVPVRADVWEASVTSAPPLSSRRSRWDGYGDGGAVFTDNDEWAALLKSYRIHGKGTGKYDNVRIGMNSRLDTIQAAILQVKLQAFEEYELEDVNRVAAVYTEQLKDCVKVPEIPEGYLSGWAQYSIILKDKEERDSLQAYLKEQGCSIHDLLSQGNASADRFCRM